jgi:hypothetical protein
MKAASVTKFIIGVIVFLGALTLWLLDSFQRLDYLKGNHPQFYSWLVSPTVQYGIIAVGVVVMIAGFVEMVRTRQKTVPSPAPVATPLGSAITTPSNAAVQMLVHREGRPPDAPEPKPSLEVRFSDSEPYRFVEVPNFTHYRMGIFNADPVGADNLCVELVAIKPRPKAEIFRADYKYRVRWAHGSTRDNAGFNLNPQQEVLFELLWFWISSTGELMVDGIDTKQGSSLSRFAVRRGESWHMHYTITCRNSNPINVVFFVRRKKNALELSRIS